MGFSTKKWQRVIDEFYFKYTGIAKGHQRDIQFVKENGYLEIPSGRQYIFEPTYRRGEWQWPLTTIKNYPIQGFGAELVMLFRIYFYQQLIESGIEFKMVQTIHDSIVVDTPSKNLDFVAALAHKCIDKVPELAYNNWSYKFSLPLTVEVKYGINKKEMTEWHSK